MDIATDKKHRNFYLTALLMMIPMTVQGLMDNFISLFNTFICGQFQNGIYSSDDIVAGIGSQTNVFEIVWYGLIGLVIAGNVYTSQYYGAKDFAKVRETMNTKLCYMVGFALISLIIVESATPNIISAIIGGENAAGGADNAIHIGVQYTRIAAISYSLLAISYCFAMTMNAIGKIKITLLASLVGILINLLVSCSFGFIGDHDTMFKVDGLAVGVILSWFGSTMVYVIYFLIKKPIFRPYFNIFYITKNMHKKMIKTSIPNVANQLMLGFALVIQIAIFARNGGPQAIAALQIVLTIFTLLFSIFRPLTGLTAFFVGKELGANNTKQAKENAWRIIFLVFIVSLIIALLFLSMSWWVPQTLYPNLSYYTKSLASWYLYFAPILFLCTALIQLLSLILGIGGYQLYASIANITMLWMLDVLVVFLLFQYTSLTIHYVLMIGCLLKLIELAVIFTMFLLIPWNRNLVVREKSYAPSHATPGQKLYHQRWMKKKQTPNNPNQPLSGN